MFKVDKYYQMDNHRLELEAGKFHIGEYAPNGRISRKLIIEQLIAKDLANNSRFAILISAISLILSLIVLFFK